ncbi:hypothetical protein [Nocardioides sp. YIM 152588]|uniref:hypothetical protein n=1 Tax=Nocardioides sp. YIM 152588 TaxID=3158259 RepID=UPI0032E4CA98
MPTTRPRYQVTETPDVARALDLAARRWPGESRSRLLLRVLQAGSEVLEEERVEAIGRRLAALDETSGKYADVFSPDFLVELREDWPE